VLQESKARFRTLTETIASAIFIHQGTECRYVNRAAEAITGYSREELLAMSSWDLVHPDSRKLVMEQGLARLRGEQTPGRFEIKILTKQGEARWLDVTVAMIEHNGRPAGLTTAFDITERKRAEDEVRHLVASDPLTGLANYRRLLEVFDAEAKRSKRTGRPFALLLLDLDGLKKINDAQGHLVGSRALCRLANVLRLHCRAIDIAARHGGDEFALILPETAMEAAQQVARRICERLANDGEQPPLSVSIGAASYPQDGETIDQLLSAADRALYRVKASIGETGSLPSLARGAPSI
jgi:diguanylate cyclase (GGDEF)-like protein/PAS domain S-box-containing protein